MRKLLILGVSAVMLTASPIAATSAFADPHYVPTKKCFFFKWGDNCKKTPSYNKVTNNVWQDIRQNDGNSASKGGLVNNESADAYNDSNIENKVSGKHNTVYNSVSQSIVQNSDNTAEKGGEVNNESADADNYSNIENKIDGDHNSATTNVTQSITQNSGNTASMGGEVNNESADAGNDSNVENKIE